jgi:hypothetical protein
MLNNNELQQLRRDGFVEAADEIVDLREALRLSTNGLATVTGWSITDETRAAIITQIISNRMLLPDTPPDEIAQERAESAAEDRQVIMGRVKNRFASGQPFDGKDVDALREVEASLDEESGPCSPR